MGTKIPLYRTIAMEVPNGHLEVVREGDSKYVYYHNPIYKGSPFKCTVCYGLSWSAEAIARDSEVLKFISRITGDYL